MADQQQRELAELKHRRGWWASVIFMIVIVGLIIFLTYVRMVDDNREIIIGIIGMLTGSISSMLAIASGRDPSEIEDLKEKLGKANADREALIARLRDAQIQLQLHRDQLHDLQRAMLDRLSLFSGVIRQRQEGEVKLPADVEAWLPNTVSKGETEDIEKK
jgi:ABC-type Na+ efflux pump permease subunit